MERNSSADQKDSHDENREKAKQNNSAANKDIKESEASIPLEDSYPLF